MRFLGLIAVLAIIYYAYSKRLGPGPDRVEGAMQEYSQTAPAQSANSSKSTTAKPAPATSNLRRPLDTTRNVLDQVKQRNGNHDF
jgi:hypothetical protein